MKTKIIDILDPQAGTIKETVVDSTPPQKTDEENEYRLRGIYEGRTSAGLKELGLGKYRSLREAASTSEFPTLMRMGLKQILFQEYNETPTTYGEWIRVEASDKMAEDWLEMNRIGTLPIVDQLDAYPELNVATDRTVRIANNKYGAIFAVTEEMIKFDKSNQIRQYPMELGAAAKQTIEATAYSVLTTAGNYVRTTAAGDEQHCLLFSEN